MSVNGQSKSKDHVKVLLTDTLAKKIEFFIKKYPNYNLNDFPVIIVDFDDEVTICGKNFLNVTFSTFYDFIDLIISNDGDMFLHGGEVLKRKIVIRVNVKMNVFIKTDAYYASQLKKMDEKYYKLFIKMCQKQITKKNDGICKGMSTIKYSPKMNLIYNENEELVNSIFEDESNNKFLMRLREKGIKYELY